MWQKIVEILLSKYLSRQTPKRKAAKAFVQLYHSMLICNETFKNYIVLKNEDARIKDAQYDWRFAVLTLANNLFKLRMALHIYQPELYSIILSYTLTESEAAAIARQGYENIDEFLVSLDEDEQPYHETGRFERFIKETQQLEAAEFEHALERLGVFIKGHFTLEDIVDA